MSDKIDRVILAALLPVACLSALMFVAKKYVFLDFSIYPINHPFTSIPSIRPVPVFP